MKKRTFVFGFPGARGNEFDGVGCNCNLYLLLSTGRMGIVFQERNELSFYEARRANGNRYF